MAEQSCNTFEITINDEVYYCYVSRITDESVVFWLGRTPRSTFVSLGFQSSGGDESVKFSRVLEPINYNSTMMSNVSLKLSRLLGGKQVFLVSDVEVDVTKSEFWRDALEILSKRISST